MSHSFVANTLDVIQQSDSYGARGWSIALRITHLILQDVEAKSSVSRSEFINFEDFPDEFLVPEAVAAVISMEYNCTLEDALLLSWLSENFGQMEYPSDIECPILAKVRLASSTSELKALVSGGESAFLDSTINFPVAANEL